MKTKPIITAGVVLLSFVAAYIWFSQDAVETNQSSIMRDESPRQSTANPRAAESTKARTLSTQSNRINSPSIKPKMSNEAIREVKHTAKKTTTAFEVAVDDETGKRSRWFQQLKIWHQLLETAAQSGLREDLFALVPITAAFFARDREAEILCEPLDDLRHWMQHPAPFIIRELSKVTEENGGQLDAGTASIAIQVFSVRGFVSDPDWENEHLPIDAAGVVVAMPLDAQQLEQLPFLQLTHLIRNQDADRFFRRYVQSGGGMPALRQRYLENRAAIHGRFKVLASKVADYQASEQQK